jgi:hypothetical protein
LFIMLGTRWASCRYLKEHTIMYRKWGTCKRESTVWVNPESSNRWMLSKNSQIAARNKIDKSWSCTGLCA